VTRKLHIGGILSRIKRRVSGCTVITFSMLSLLPNAAFSITGVEVYENESYDKDVIYYTYFKLYLVYEYLNMQPSEMEEIVQSYEVKQRYVLPQLPNYVLYVVEIDAPEPEEGRDLVLVFRDKAGGRYRERYYNYWHLAAPAFINHDYKNYFVNYRGLYDLFLIEVLDIPRSYSGGLPGAIELCLLAYYLYELRYEDIDYLYENGFHVLDSDNLPSRLEDGLNESERTLLMDCLDRRYYKIFRQTDRQEIPYEFYGICTWSEYGGELIFWDFFYDYEIHGEWELCRVRAKKDVVSILNPKYNLDLEIETPSLELEYNPADDYFYGRAWEPGKVK
jgi:hypothetical protein